MTKYAFGCFLVFFAMGMSAMATPPPLPPTPPTPTLTYRVEVPAAAMGDCQTQADQIASIFAQVTALPGVSGACEGTRTIEDQGASYGLDEVVISYQADQPVQPVASVFGGDIFQGEATEEQGLFADYADCLAERAKQVALFEQETGLTSVDSRCDAALDDPSTGFVLTVESFGTPAKTLQAFQVDTDTTGNVPTGSDVMNSVETMIMSQGGDVSWSDSSRIFYYASGPLDIMESALGFFDVTSECQGQVTDAQMIFSQISQSATVFCDANLDGSKTGETLVVVAASYDVTTLTDDQDHYGTYADCVTDKTRAINQAIATNGRVYGGICAPALGGTGYTLTLYL